MSLRDIKIPKFKFKKMKMNMDELEKIDYENCKDCLRFKYVKPHHANAPKETWDEDLDR